MISSLARNRWSPGLLSARESLPTPVKCVADFNINGLGSVARSAICLTFDDGPDPLYTPKLLDILARYDAKATFFVMGEAAQKYPKLLEKIVESGHAIGNHTYSHGHPWIMTAARARDEVGKTTHLIKSIIGAAPRWFRPPFGRLRNAMRRQAHVEGMTTVLWNHSIIDWGPLGTTKGIKQRMDYIGSGDIVLMHDGKREHNHPEIMLRCLPDCLRSLHERSVVTATPDDFFSD